MAKHQKKHKRRRRRGHRVGALALNPNQPVIQLAAAALGYFLAADPVNTALDKVIPDSIKNATDVKKYIPGAVETGIGAYLLLGKGRKTLVKTIVGGVAAGAGIKRLLKQAGVIQGYQAVPVVGTHRRRMAGYQSVPVVGSSMPPQLSGTPAQLQGYRVNGPGYVPHGSGVMGSINGIGNFDGRNGSGITYGGSSGYMG